MVVVTLERLQEVLDEAVARGRMTRDDAGALLTDLLSRGRKQTDDLREDIEGLLGGAARPPGRAWPAPPTACCARSTARAASPASGPSFPILGYDDLTAAQVNERLGDLDPPSCARCATTRSATRTASRCSRRSSRSSSSGRARRAVILGGVSSAAPSSSRPRRGDELELTVDSLAYGGNGVARRDGYVVFVAGGLPGDRVRAVVGKAKRAYAEARTVEILEPSPDRLPRGRRPPGRAVAGAALRAPARGQGRAGRRRR